MKTVVIGTPNEKQQKFLLLLSHILKTMTLCFLQTTVLWQLVVMFLQHFIEWKALNFGQKSLSMQ